MQWVLNLITPYSIKNKKWKTCQVFRLIKYTILRKILGQFELYGSSMSQKKLGKGQQKAGKISGTSKSRRNMLQLISNGSVTWLCIKKKGS